MELTTLCYIRRGDSFLMLYRNKKKNDINKGKYIGVGGHFLPGETPLQCIRREIYEETSLRARRLTPRGIVTFVYGDVIEYMHLFTCEDYEGEIGDCDEGELSFINFEDILNLRLWEGDRIFLKKLMEDEDYFFLRLIYNEDGSLREWELSE